MAFASLASRAFLPAAPRQSLRRRGSPPVLSQSPPPSPSPPPALRPLAATRRTASATLVLVLIFGSSAAQNNHALAANPFDKYLKRKKLDPLEAYVPAVLLTRAQIEDLEVALDSEEPRYDLGRSLLRSGPAASLRMNIRAVAQYAADDGNGKAASDAVDRCLRALEELDSLLLQASRNERTATVESMKGKINIAVGALDSLLQTVPPPVLDKGKAIADAYRTPNNYNEGQSADSNPNIKQLEEIL